MCGTIPAMMIRTARYKLWYDCHEKDGEMYDLEKDPLELNNLYNDPNFGELRRELFERMLHRRMYDDYISGIPTDRERRLLQEVQASYEPEV